MKKNSLGETLMGCLMYAYYERKIWLGVFLSLVVVLFGYVTVTSFIFTIDFLKSVAGAR